MIELASGLANQLGAFFLEGGHIRPHLLNLIDLVEISKKQTQASNCPQSGTCNSILVDIAKMTKAEKEAAKRKKKGPTAIKYAVTASGRRRKKKA